MKRYKPILAIVHDNDIDGNQHPISVDIEMFEMPDDGEWVKWKDSKDELFRFSEIYEQRIRELKSKIGQECNCEEKAKAMQMGYNCEIRNNDAVMINSWICPAHGYKRR